MSLTAASRRKAIIGAAIAAVALAVLGGLATEIGPWYYALKKPSWQPPDWLFGPVWTTMLGTPQELADAFLAYERIGVTELILSGWPELDTVETFGREVLPLIREGEACR